MWLVLLNKHVDTEKNAYNCIIFNVQISHSQTMAPGSPILMALGQGKLVQVSIDFVFRLDTTDYSTAISPLISSP